MRGFVPQLRTLLVSSSLLLAAAHASAQTLKGQHRQATSGPPAPGGLAHQVPLRVSPTAVDFGPVPSGQQQSIGLTLHNTGTQTVELKMVRFLLGDSGNSAAFQIGRASR